MSQPESLRLADAWDQAISTRRHVSIGCEMADELRRLTAENEALRAVVADAVAAERMACAELMERQHTWITNVAASALIRARGTP